MLNMQVCYSVWCHLQGYSTLLSIRLPSHLLHTGSWWADFRPWTWKWYFPSKRRFVYRLHGAISLKMTIFIITSVRTSNPVNLLSTCSSHFCVLEWNVSSSSNPSYAFSSSPTTFIIISSHMEEGITEQFKPLCFLYSGKCFVGAFHGNLPHVTNIDKGSTQQY
jgi:hypothetical protein